MNLLNECVEHIIFGDGVVTEVDENRIYVQFQNNIGTKLFQNPEAFEKFLKATNPKVENNVLEELHIKLEQLEQERMEKEREAAELEEKLKQLEPVKKKAVSRKTKKKD